MAGLERAEWWAWRPARSHAPKTYRCPFCGELLHATSDHVVLAPEGDASRRRHAHTECVAGARRDGCLASRAEWRAANRPPGLLARLLRR